ncbi:Ser/Thr phosphatase family protein [Anaerococcus hydrogenalis]|nr:Ser/Thr phosphatase family protein [Anaerococcus hydrogenalis]
MKNKNKLFLALLIASVTTTIFPENVSFASEDASTNVEITEKQNQEGKENIADIPKDDEVTFPKNEKNTRESDGTNKFNRATETERESFGEDKNVGNIDSKVKEKLDQTKGEYGKKNGSYANNNLKAINTPIKDITINPGQNENEVAVTWFGKGEVNENSKLIFNNKEYKPIRARKTGDSNGYSTYTSIVQIKPGENYNYYITNEDFKSNIFTLRTKALGKNNEFSLVYLGDPQMGSGDSVWDKHGLNKNTQAKVDQDKADFAKTLKKAQELDPNFYFSMGDNVEIAGYEGEYDYFFDNDLFKERIFSSITGNHETYIDGKDSSLQNTVFSDHFYLANESKLGSISKENEDGTRTYIPGDFWYSYGDTLFLNLNSNVNDSKEHEKFIQEAIKQAEEKRGSKFSWKVVSFHHAPYSTATHTTDDDILQRRNELVKIFNKNNIDLVLNGHDHIYTRSKHMLGGEKTLSFKDAYGTDLNDPNAEIKDSFSETFNNKIYPNGKVIVDGIGIDYGKNQVVNPKGTLFLTMSASAGAKFYNPIGEDQWFVNRSLDDRSQLFSHLTFSKNQFKIVTMDQDGKVVDTYTINKTDEKINNPKFDENKTDFSKLQKTIENIMNKNVVLKEENITTYNIAVENAVKVLNDKNASQEEVDNAIEVLNTRLSEVSFEKKEEKTNTNNESANVTDDNKDDQKSNCENGSSNKSKHKGKKVKAENSKKDSDFENKSLNKIYTKSTNVKTGVKSLSSIFASLSLALVGLFKIKRK